MLNSHAKFVYWLKILSKFISVQLLVQGLGLGSGLLLVRTLNKQEYAYFTLANSLQATMSLLADSGISSALSAIGGKVWQDPYRFGQLINTAMQWRRTLAVFAIILISPLLLWMLLKNGASISYATLLVAGVVIELNFYLSDGVLRVVLRLNSQINQIQRLDLLFAISRLTLLLGSLSIFLNAAVGIFASTISSGIKNWFLWQWVKKTVELKAPINQDDEKGILKIVKYQAPNTIFYSFQGQLTIWLITIFGSTQNIAEIGALSRLGVFFSIISSIMNNIVLPSFARCQLYEVLLKRYISIIGAYLLIASFLLAFASVFSHQLLWLLGQQYSNLEEQVFFIVLSTMTNSIAGILWSINTSKGWLEQAWMFVPTIIFTQVLLITCTNLDFSTIRDVLLFNTFSIIPAACINFYMTYKGLKSMKPS